MPLQTDPIMGVRPISAGPSVLLGQRLPPRIPRGRAAFLAEKVSEEPGAVAPRSTSAETGKNGSRIRIAGRWPNARRLLREGRRHAASSGIGTIVAETKPKLKPGV